MQLILDEMTAMNDKLVSAQVEDYVLTLTAALSDIADGSGDVVGLGAGRMGYALRAFIMRLSHMGFRTSMIGDTSVPRVKSNTVVFINSSSGETPSIALFAEQAKAEGARIFSTTCSTLSSIGARSEKIIVLPEVSSSQLMKSPYEQFTMLLYDYIIIRLMANLQLDAQHVSHNHSILE